MTNLNLKSTITLNDEQYLVEELVNHLSKLPAEEVVNFFKTLQISVPRILRIRILKNVLRDEVIFTRQRLATLADETNYRLSWFRKFAEYQLENYLEEFKKPELKQEFLTQLWVMFLNYFVERQVSFTDVLELVEKAKEYQVLPVDMLHYNKTLNSIFYDDTNKIDGLTPAQFRPVLYKSSTIPQIREIGLKYNVDVPKRLKKQQLLDIVYEVLKEREQYTEELEEVLKKKNIIQIQRFCIDNDIKASTELKKEEIIEYILRNAAETRQDYFLPTNHSAYEYEVTDFDVEEDEQEIVEKEQEYLADQIAELERKSKEKETFVALDKTQLFNLLNLRQDQLSSNHYDEKSNEELKEKINLGNDVLQNPNLTQEQINEAVEQLRSLTLNEKVIVDKNELIQLLNLRQEQLESNQYDEQTNETLKERILLGNKALESDVLNQEEINEVVKHLKDIELVLPVEEVKVNKEELQRLIQLRQEDLKSLKYNEETNKVLEEKIQTGLKTLEDESLSQEEVNNITNELLSVVLVEKEEEKQVDKQELQRLVEIRKEQLDSEKYTDLTNEQLEEKIQTGLKALENETLSQEEVDSVVNYLHDIVLEERKVLEVNHLVNLKNHKQEDLNLENKTLESKQGLTDLLNLIEEKLNDENLTQEQVDSLYEQLLNYHLVDVLVDKEKLQQLHDLRENELEKDLEESSKLELSKALQVAVLCLNDKTATQANVDEVYEHLKSIEVKEKEILDLSNLLNILKAKKEQLENGTYTTSSYEEVKDAIEKIEKSLNEDKLSQSQVLHYERYLNSLELVEYKEEVKVEVEEKQVVNKEALRQLQEEKAKELQEEKHYTEDSYNTLFNALKVTQLCLEDNNATQENVDEVYNHLNSIVLVEEEVIEEVVEELPVVEEVIEVTEIEENEEERVILEVKHLDFTTGSEKTIFIRKGKELRPIYAPEVLEKDGVEYKFDYWTLLGDEEEKEFEFNQPLLESITLIPVFSLNTPEEVVEEQEEVVLEETPQVEEEVIEEVVEKTPVEEETIYYIHDYVTDLEELVKTQNQFIKDTENIEDIYTEKSYENFKNNLIVSEQLLAENPDNALCRVQYNLLAASRFNLIEKQKEVEVDEVIVAPVKEEVIEEVLPVEEKQEESIEIVEDALVSDKVETTEVVQPEEVEVDLDYEPKQFYKVLETPQEKEVIKTTERVVETQIKSAETVINNYYYQGTINNQAPINPVSYEIPTPQFDNLKVNAASYDTSDRTKTVDYEQLSGEKLNDKPQDCDCMYTHKRDWLFIIFAFFVLIAIAIAIALIVYRLIVFWN